MKTSAMNLATSLLLGWMPPPAHFVPPRERGRTKKPSKMYLDGHDKSRECLRRGFDGSRPSGDYIFFALPSGNGRRSDRKAHENKRLARWRAANSGVSAARAPAHIREMARG